MSPYIWFSGATDITGRNLATALNIQGGTTAPGAGAKTVICWGTKTKESVSFPAGVKVLNNPDAIRKNRNKFESTTALCTALNIGGAKHVAAVRSADTVMAALSSGEISLPLIGRRKYHQGGKGFWPCPTIVQVKEALALPSEDRAQYFQEMIPVKTEYRLHVFGDDVIHAVKKVKRTAAEFEAAFIEDELNRQKTLAEKNNNPFDEATALTMLKRQAKNATAGGPNMLLRSNRLGWKFSIITKYSNGLKDVAVAAVKALGLDFGAVDACVAEDGNVYVFEVNTGPGLEATSFDKYVAAFKVALSGAKSAKTAAQTVSATAEPAPTTAVKPGASGRKQLLTEQVGRLQQMLADVEDGNEQELATIERLGRTLIFGSSE